jgi:phage terminase small subunit
MTENKKPALSPLHRLFAYEVLGGASAAEAYRTVYPRASAATAETNGPRLLRSAQVAAFVEERRAKVLAKAEITSEVRLERVLLELNRILQADPADALNDDGSPKPLKEWPKDLRQALAGMDVEDIWEGSGKDRVFVGQLRKWKYWNKTDAASQLMRHLGAFADRVSVTGAIGPALGLSDADLDVALSPPESVN